MLGAIIGDIVGSIYEIEERRKRCQKKRYMFNINLFIIYYHN